MISALTETATSSAWGRSDTWALAGVSLTFFGFLVTIIQLGRTKKAAEAAKDAGARTHHRLANNHLLLLIPQLERIEIDLDAAVKAEQSELIAFHLNNWRWQANVVRTLLARAGRAESEFSEKIQVSIAACSTAKLALKPDADLERVTKQVRKATSEVVDELGSVATLISNSEVETQ